ncbi:MAG: TetR/AcrR family transcriptional regulator [Gammaproteobacteria bacterium]
MATEVSAPRTGRRERKRTDTEQRILQVALRLFCDQGFAATTVEQIASGADIAKGTFFNYFSSKEQLIFAFGERLVGRLAAAAGAITDSAPIREQVRAAMHLLVGEWRGNKRLLRSMLSIGMASDHMSKHLGKLLASGRANVTVLMREAQRRGEVRADISAEDLARLLQQSMMGAQIIWSLAPANNLVAMADQTLNVFWRGIETGDSSKLSARQRQLPQ